MGKHNKAEKRNDSFNATKTIMNSKERTEEMRAAAKAFAVASKDAVKGIKAASKLIGDAFLGSTRSFIESEARLAEATRLVTEDAKRPTTRDSDELFDKPLPVYQQATPERPAYLIGKDSYCKKHGVTWNSTECGECKLANALDKDYEAVINAPGRPHHGEKGAVCKVSDSGEGIDISVLMYTVDERGRDIVLDLKLDDVTIVKRATLKEDKDLTGDDGVNAYTYCEKHDVAVDADSTCAMCIKDYEKEGEEKYFSCIDSRKNVVELKNGQRVRHASSSLNQRVPGESRMTCYRYGKSDADYNLFNVTLDDLVVTLNEDLPEMQPETSEETVKRILADKEQAALHSDLSFLHEDIEEQQNKRIAESYDKGDLGQSVELTANDTANLASLECGDLDDDDDEWTSQLYIDCAAFISQFMIQEMLPISTSAMKVAALMTDKAKEQEAECKSKKEE